MKILFAGAAGEVTGSKHLLTFNGKNILLDCGLSQGKRKEADEKNRNLLFDVDTLDAVVLSHAHIDHSGLLPLLTKRGYEGPIYCTRATMDLCGYMLADSAFIQEREIEWLKEKNKLKDGITEPLYTVADAEKVMTQFVPMDYEKSFEVVPGMSVSFYDAGHILGSSLVHMTFKSAKKEDPLRICFTGDLGRRGLPILRDPHAIPKSDIVISETTYGNRLHAALQTVEEDLAVIVNKVCADGGKLIIPAFALERTQEIVYHLHLLADKNLIPNIPIYVDSPLAGNVTEVFRSHMECYDEKTKEEFSKHADNPFGFEDLTYTRSVEESKALNEKTGPMIIISASGMCEHGRIVHHLRNNIENSKNVILIVGYQAENTLGRKLVQGDKSVNIFGDPYHVKAKVYVMDAFSAHADRSDLLDYLSHVEDLKKIVLVHGEQTQLDAFEHALNENGFEDVFIPKPGDVLDIDFE